MKLEPRIFPVTSDLKPADEAEAAGWSFILHATAGPVFASSKLFPSQHAAHRSATRKVRQLLNEPTPPNTVTPAPVGMRVDAPAPVAD